MNGADAESESRQLNLFDEAPESTPRRTAIESVDNESRAIREEIEEARIAKHLSKADLARSVGKNPAAIRRLLTNENFNPELHTLIQLAEAVGLTVKLERKKRTYRRKAID